MTQPPIIAKIDELSTSFDDYHAEARKKYEGTHVFVGVHIPVEYAQQLTCRTHLAITIVSDDGPEADAQHNRTP